MTTTALRHDDGRYGEAKVLTTTNTKDEFDWIFVSVFLGGLGGYLSLLRRAVGIHSDCAKKTGPAIFALGIAGPGVLGGRTLCFRWRPR